jgi:hypothetical protein
LLLHADQPSRNETEHLKILIREANQGRTTMPELTPIEVESPSNRKCQVCDVTMRLFGVETHPTIDRMDLRTYVCPQCDAVETEIVSIPPELNSPIRALFAGRGFDAETTRLLGSTFDAAWEAVVTSGTPLGDPQHAASIRELLARCIVNMFQLGETDTNRLAENALHSVLRH